MTATLVTSRAASEHLPGQDSAPLVKLRARGHRPRQRGLSGAYAYVSCAFWAVGLAAARLPPLHPLRHRQLPAPSSLSCASCHARCVSV